MERGGTMAHALRALAIGVLALGLAGCLRDDPAAQSARADGTGACRVTKVVDGDTVYLRCPGAQPRRARLLGFDTPEAFSPKCRAEKRLADKATRYLRREIRGASAFSFQFRGHDRYGRDLVRMMIDGQDIADIMVSQGLAVRYHGGRKIDWCARLVQT